MITYSIYGRMSFDETTREGQWYCVKTGVSEENTAEVMAYYRKTWRYVQRRMECVISGKGVS